MTRVARRAREFPELYPVALRSDGLDHRDAGLAYAIDQAVARRWLTLEAVLRSQLSRPWADLHPPVQSALMVGAVQLLLMERVPDHAAVGESVAWVATRVAPAVSLVNAVLRRVARLRGDDGPIAAGEDRVAWDRDELPWHDGRVLHLNEPVFSLDPLDRLGEQTSHPRALLESWTTRFGSRQASELAAHDLVHPPIIVTGTDVPADCAPHEEPGFAVFPGGRSELEAMLERCPGTWAQDPASAQAVLATADLAPRLIVEVCAGKGTQTRQLAALHPQAGIVASDTSPDRLETLRRSIRDERVRVVEPQELLEYAGRADLVVVDAPCSNTAVLARRVEARYRYGPASLRNLGDLQRQILADALRFPSPAGCLLYSTCSLEPEENQGQREWLSRWHGVRLLREGQCLPRGRPGDPPARYRDGAYHAILQRR